MAGDTPTPIYNTKEGTRFENGAGFDLHLADETLLPYNAVDERRRVEAAMQPPMHEEADAPSAPPEFNLRPTNPAEALQLLSQLAIIRLERMNLEDTPFLKEAS